MKSESMRLFVAVLAIGAFGLAIWYWGKRQVQAVRGRGKAQILDWLACIGTDWWNERFLIPLTPDEPIDADGKPLYVGVEWQNTGNEAMLSYCRFKVERDSAMQEIDTQTVGLERGEVAEESVISLHNMGNGWYRLTATIYEKDTKLDSEWIEVEILW